MYRFLLTHCPPGLLDFFFHSYLLSFSPFSFLHIFKVSGFGTLHRPPGLCLSKVCFHLLSGPFCQEKYSDWNRIHVIVRVLGLLMPKHPLHPWKSICKAPPLGWRFMETLCAVRFGLYVSVFSASRLFCWLSMKYTFGASCRIPMRVDAVASNSF